MFFGKQKKERENERKKEKVVLALHCTVAKNGDGSDDQLWDETVLT